MGFYGYEVLRLWGFAVMGFYGYGVLRLWGFMVMGFYGYGVLRLWGFTVMFFTVMGFGGLTVLWFRVLRLYFSSNQPYSPITAKP